MNASQKILALFTSPSLGLRAATIRNELPDVPASTVTSRCTVMVQKGQLTRNEAGYYFIVANYKEKKKTPAVNLVAIANDSIKQQVIELMQWKAWAISKHPDLDIPEETLQARRIVSEFYLKIGDKEKANQAKEGKLDNAPVVQIAMMAMG